MVHTEFWDAVNFAHGAVRPREQWVLPHRRSKDDAERCFRILKAYVEHAKTIPDVEFVTATDLLRIYANPIPPVVSRIELARHFLRGIHFLSTGAGDLSAADILLELLGLPVRYVDGPTQRGATNYADPTIHDFLFEDTLNDVRSFIQTNHRLPSEVFVGSKTLSVEDFAATLAEHVVSPGLIRVKRGKLNFERYFSTDARRSFNWPIHPEGFAPEELLALARLQGWTLKPARLR
jgi:hypothetical protein